MGPSSGEAPWSRQGSRVASREVILCRIITRASQAMTWSIALLPSTVARKPRAIGHGHAVGPAPRRIGPGSGTGPDLSSVVRSVLSWSPADQDRDRRVANGLVSLSVASVVSASARSICASAVPMPRTRTGKQDTMVVIAYGARFIPLGIGWWATCPAMPRPNEQIADHLANRRVRALIAGSRASQARSAYAAYASTRDRERDSRVQVKAGQIPGREDQTEAGLLRDPDPAGPHLGRSRDSQDQQRPGPRLGPPGLPVLPDGRANPGLSAARSNGSCGRLEVPVLGVKHAVRARWHRP
jgi:hypothetical protein